VLLKGLPVSSFYVFDHDTFILNFVIECAPCLNVVFVIFVDVRQWPKHITTISVAIGCLVLLAVGGSLLRESPPLSAVAGMPAKRTPPSSTAKAAAPVSAWTGRKKPKKEMPEAAGEPVVVGAGAPEVALARRTPEEAQKCMAAWAPEVDPNNPRHVDAYLSVAASKTRVRKEAVHLGVHARPRGRRCTGGRARVGGCARAGGRAQPGGCARTGARAGGCGQAGVSSSPDALVRDRRGTGVNPGGRNGRAGAFSSPGAFVRHRRVTGGNPGGRPAEAAAVVEQNVGCLFYRRGDNLVRRCGGMRQSSRGGPNHEPRPQQ